MRFVAIFCLFVAYVALLGCTIAHAAETRQAFPKIPAKLRTQLLLHRPLPPTPLDRVSYRFSINGGLSEGDAVMIADVYDVFAAGLASRHLIHARYPEAELRFGRTYKSNGRYFDVWQVSPPGQKRFEFFIDSTYFSTDA